MAGTRKIFASGSGRIGVETFRFFGDLHRNNRTEWMEEHRERYRSAVVQPFRELLEELAPVVLKLDPGFDVGGKTGVNFSRINRDIRFAKDKTPYRPQMYLLFPPQGGKKRGPGELYVGVGKDVVTAGFRVYFDRDTKAALGARMAKIPRWCAGQKRRLGRAYETYWHSMEKGEWTKHEGWPVAEEEWKKLLAWIVRRKITPAGASRAGFANEVAKIFREMFPLFKFLARPE